MTRIVASLNAGSSSIKFALFADAPSGPVRRLGGMLEGIGTAPHLIARNPGGNILVDRRWDDPALDHEALLGELLRWLAEHADGPVAAVGHRVVHGGTAFVAPRRVDAALVDALDALSPLAPLHQPHNLAPIRAILALAPDLPQIVCFDTAFHHGRAEVATRFALPRAMHERGIRRYGFHGISYDYVARRLRQIDPMLAAGRVIAAHLGNGASLCAMADGRSVDTSMGFTALDGLVMGTRCGNLDPGVILHLLQQEGMTAADVEALLYRQSGLLGVSGVSSDMRALWASADPRAMEAIELFVWRAAREAAALLPALGGLDGLVFTAGIGENDPGIRARIVEHLAFTGARLDPAANAAHAPVISTPESPVIIRIVPTDEEAMIADAAFSILSPG